MLKVSFVLVVLLVAKGLVSAHPVIARAPAITVVARDVSNASPSLTERLFNVVVDSLSAHHPSAGSSQAVATLSPPSPSSADKEESDLDDRAFYEDSIESRGLESKLKRRTMDDDEYMEVLARALYEGSLDARDFEPIQRRFIEENQGNEQGNQWGNEGTSGTSGHAGQPEEHQSEPPHVPAEPAAGTQPAAGIQPGGRIGSLLNHPVAKQLAHAVKSVAGHPLTHQIVNGWVARQGGGGGQPAAA